MSTFSEKIKKIRQPEELLRKRADAESVMRKNKGKTSKPYKNLIEEQVVIIDTIDWVLSSDKNKGKDVLAYYSTKQLRKEVERRESK